jgi:hypothetical protein
MSYNLSNSVNSAIVSGQFGLSRASNNITQNAFNIAQLSSTSQQSQDPQTFLVEAVKTQLGVVKQMLPTASGDITSELVSLSVNSLNAQASAKVMGTANDTVGTILDILV